MTLRTHYCPFNRAWTCDVLSAGRVVALANWYETEARAVRAGRRLARRMGREHQTTELV